MITPIPSYYTTIVWPKVVELIRPAVERSDCGYTVDDVLRKLQVSDMQLWVINEYQAACITHVLTFPQHKVAVLVALGGEGMDEWLDELLEMVEKWAQDIGCAYIEEYGRPGWERVGKNRGWEKQYVVMRKAVNG